MGIENSGGAYRGHETLVRAVVLDEMQFAVHSLGFDRREADEEIRDRRKFQDPTFPPEKDRREGDRRQADLRQVLPGLPGFPGLPVRDT